MKNWLRGALLLLGYGGLFLLFTWPLAQHFSTVLLAKPGSDAALFFWNVWHFREAVQTGHNPFVTDWMLYPKPATLIMHAYTPILGMLSVVLGNEVRAINAGMLLSYALSGAGAYLLARRWVRHPLLCLLVGFIFAFSPYKLQRLTEHYNLVLTATVPFFILLFLRAFVFQKGRFWPSVRSWGSVAGCCVLGVITLLSDYYVLFALLYFAGLYAAWFGLRLGQIRWNTWRPWAILVTGLVVSHVGIRLLRMSGLNDNGGFWWGGDVVAYLLPPPGSRFLYGSWAAQLYHNAKVFNMPGSLENTLFLGYTLLGLALAMAVIRLATRRAPSLRAADEQGRPLAWVLLVFVLLTVPALRIYGHERLNLPTGLLHFVPFFNNIRCPTRWVMMVGLLLPIVTFSSLEATWQQLRPTVQTAIASVLLLLIGLEFWPAPFPQVAAAQVPAVYRQVAQLPGVSLIPVPLGVLDGFREVGTMQPEQLRYQAVHHKKLPAGYLSRVRPEYFAALRQEPVLRAILYQQTKPDTVQPTPPTPQQMQHFLTTYRPSAFVIEPAYRNQPVHQYLRQLLQPYGFQEQLVNGYVLLAPKGE